MQYKLMIEFFYRYMIHDHDTYQQTDFQSKRFHID